MNDRHLDIALCNREVCYAFHGSKDCNSVKKRFILKL
jgi:hypothetical protein